MKGREQSSTPCCNSSPGGGGRTLWGDREGTGPLHLVSPLRYCHIHSFRHASEPSAGLGLATSRERQLPPGLSISIMAGGRAQRREVSTGCRRPAGRAGSKGELLVSRREL